MNTPSARPFLGIVLALLLIPSLASAATFERPLSLGSTGSDVSALQTLLKGLGFYTYAEITGYFGQATLQAVADFQKARGLESLGYVGPQTRMLLNGETASSTPVVSSSLSALITSLQQLLRNAGFYEVELTGAMDAATIAASQSISSSGATASAPRRSGGVKHSSHDDDDEEVVVETPEDPVPDFERSFSRVVSTYDSSVDLTFGTGALPAGSTAVTNVGDLATYFNPYSENAGTTVINREIQWYQTFSNPQNFVFSNDGLELTATIDGLAGGTGLQTLSIANAVNATSTVTVADASTIRAGQVVSLGEEQFDNLHMTASIGLRGTITTGDTASVTVTPADSGLFAPITKTVTAEVGDTLTTLAQKLVDAVNADATLAANNVKAYKQPLDPGAYAITFPKKAGGSAPDFGNTADDSLRYLAITVAKTGTVVQELKQSMAVMYVVAKNGNTLTLNHAITADSGQSLYASPALMLMRTDTYVSSSTTVPVGDTTGISVGQLVQLGFQDTNLRRVVSKTATSITLNATVFVQDGVFVVVYPAYAAVTNASSGGGTTLSFAAVPADVQVGHRVIDYDGGNNNADRTVVAINRSSTPQTVTMSSGKTVASGANVYFLPPVRSAQIWSKFRMMPETDHPYLGVEWTVQTPNSADFASWPALWLYTDTNDPNPASTTDTSASEIDMMELFNYWNNSSNSEYRPGIATGTSTQLYAHPSLLSGGLRGNNTGSKERKVQMIWSANAVYFYLDDTLILARSFSWNTYKRAQFAANLAIGSVSTSFNSSGFFPIDFSRFPMSFDIKRLRILTSSGTTP